MVDSSNGVADLRLLAEDPTFPVFDLLRRAAIVAAASNFPDIKEWVENEQHGYSDDNTDLPRYRKVPGRIVSHFAGEHRTLSFPSTESETGIAYLRLPIANIASHAAQKLPYAASLSDNQLRSVKAIFPALSGVPVVLVAPETFAGVLGYVRHKVLEETFKMGTGGSTNEMPKTEADNVAVARTIHFENHGTFTGSVTGPLSAHNLSIGSGPTIHDHTYDKRSSSWFRRISKFIVAYKKTAMAIGVLLSAAIGWLHKNWNWIR